MTSSSVGAGTAASTYAATMEDGNEVCCSKGRSQLARLQNQLGDVVAIGDAARLRLNANSFRSEPMFRGGSGEDEDNLTSAKWPRTPCVSSAHRARERTLSAQVFHRLGISGVVIATTFCTTCLRTSLFRHGFPACRLRMGTSKSSRPHSPHAQAVTKDCAISVPQRATRWYCEARTAPGGR